MLTDDELLNLPDDPELAFLQYEEAARKYAQASIGDSDGYNVDDYKIEYISHVLGVVKALGLEILQDWKIPSTASSSGIIDKEYKQLLADVTHYVVQIRIKNSRRVRRYSVALDPAAKEKIRHHLGQIKEIVDRLEVPEKKREALYSKIGALENEVSRNRTTFDAAMALILEGADTAEEVGQKLEPIRKFIDSITGVFRAAKQEEELKFPSLAAPETPKQIEAPKNKLSPPEDNKGLGDLARIIHDTPRIGSARASSTGLTAVLRG